MRDTMVATFYEAPTVSVDPVAPVCRDSSLAIIPISGDFGGGADSARVLQGRPGGQRLRPQLEKANLQGHLTSG